MYRLHWQNHINCSSGYFIDTYPEFGDISSVICEVYNSHFQDIVSHAGFMRRDHFMLYTKHFMAHINSKRHKTITKECTKHGTIADKWRRINGLISSMQDEIMPEGLALCRENPCEWCKELL